MTNTASLVDSWPSTEMRSKLRFTHTPVSRSTVSGSSAASVWTKQSMVANAGEIMPPPLACPASRTVPPEGSASSRQARLGPLSVVRMRLRERLRVGAQGLGRVADAGHGLVARQLAGDHAGGGHGHVDRIQVQRLGRGGLLRAGGGQAALAVGHVGVARVHRHGAQRGQVGLAGHGHRRGHQRVRGEAGGGHGVLALGEQQAHVLALGLDARRPRRTR